MLLPFLNSKGELEEYNVDPREEYIEVPRFNKIIFVAQKFDPKFDSETYIKEAFQRKDLAFRVGQENACKVSVYVSLKFGLEIPEDQREQGIQDCLMQIGPYLFTYGQRFKIKAAPGGL